MRRPVGRAGWFRACGAVLLLAAPARSQTVFVNVETGDDRNLGDRPEAAVQTITLALGVAASDLTIPRVILPPGTVDGKGAVLAYPDDPGMSPPPSARLHFLMLRPVSVAWHEIDPDVVCVGADGDLFEIGRPVARTAVDACVLGRSSSSPGRPAVSASLLEGFVPTGRTAFPEELDADGGGRTLSVLERVRAPRHLLRGSGTSPSNL